MIVRSLSILVINLMVPKIPKIENKIEINYDFDVIFVFIFRRLYLKMLVRSLSIFGIDLMVPKIANFERLKIEHKIEIKYVHLFIINILYSKIEFVY